MHVGRVPGQEHPSDAIALGLAALAEESRRPTDCAETEIGAGDAPTRVAQFGLGDRLRDRHVVSMTIPDDQPGHPAPERQDEDESVGTGTPVQHLTGRVGQLDVGQDDVGLVLRADESDPHQLPHPTVRTIAGHDITGPIGSFPARGGDPQSHRGLVLVETDHLRAALDLHAAGDGACLQHRLGPALRNDGEQRVPAGQLAQIEGDTRDALHRLQPLRPLQHLLGQAAGIQQFEGSGVDGKGAGDVGLMLAALDQPGLDPGQGQLVGQRESGRSGADDDHLVVGHDAPNEKLRRRQTDDAWHERYGLGTDPASIKTAGREPTAAGAGPGSRTRGSTGARPASVPLR